MMVSPGRTERGSNAAMSAAASSAADGETHFSNSRFVRNIVRSIASTAADFSKRTGTYTSSARWPTSRTAWRTAPSRFLRRAPGLLAPSSASSSSRGEPDGARDAASRTASWMMRRSRRTSARAASRSVSSDASAAHSLVGTTPTCWTISAFCSAVRRPPAFRVDALAPMVRRRARASGRASARAESERSGSYLARIRAARGMLRGPKCGSVLQRASCWGSCLTP